MAAQPTATQTLLRYTLLKETIFVFGPYFRVLKAGEECEYFANTHVYLFDARDGIVPFFDRSVVQGLPEWFEPVDLSRKTISQR